MPDETPGLQGIQIFRGAEHFQVAIEIDPTISPDQIKPFLAKMNLQGYNAQVAPSLPGKPVKINLYMSQLNNLHEDRRYPPEPNKMQQIVAAAMTGRNSNVANFLKEAVETGIIKPIDRGSPLPIMYLQTDYDPISKQQIVKPIDTRSTLQGTAPDLSNAQPVPTKVAAYQKQAPIATPAADAAVTPATKPAPEKPTDADAPKTVAPQPVFPTAKPGDAAMLLNTTTPGPKAKASDYIQYNPERSLEQNLEAAKELSEKRNGRAVRMVTDIGAELVVTRHMDVAETVKFYNERSRVLAQLRDDIEVRAKRLNLAGEADVIIARPAHLNPAETIFLAIEEAKKNRNVVGVDIDGVKVIATEFSKPADLLAHYTTNERNVTMERSLFRRDANVHARLDQEAKGIKPGTPLEVRQNLHELFGGYSNDGRLADLDTVLDGLQERLPTHDINRDTLRAALQQQIDAGNPRSDLMRTLTLVAADSDRLTPGARELSVQALQDAGAITFSKEKFNRVTEIATANKTLTEVLAGRSRAVDIIDRAAAAPATEPLSTAARRRKFLYDAAELLDLPENKKRNPLSIVRELHARGIDLNDPDSRGFQPLARAVHAKNGGDVGFDLASNRRIITVGQDGRTLTGDEARTSIIGRFKEKFAAPAADAKPTDAAAPKTATAADAAPAKAATDPAALKPAAADAAVKPVNSLTTGEARWRNVDGTISMIGGSVEVAGKSEELAKQSITHRVVEAVDANGSPSGYKEIVVDPTHNEAMKANLGTALVDAVNPGDQTWPKEFGVPAKDAPTLKWDDNRVAFVLEDVKTPSTPAAATPAAKPAAQTEAANPKTPPTEAEKTKPVAAADTTQPKPQISEAEYNAAPEKLVSINRQVELRQEVANFTADQLKKAQDRLAEVDAEYNTIRRDTNSSQPSLAMAEARLSETAADLRKAYAADATAQSNLNDSIAEQEKLIKIVESGPTSERSPQAKTAPAAQKEAEAPKPVAPEFPQDVSGARKAATREQQNFAAARGQYDAAAEKVLRLQEEVSNLEGKVDSVSDKKYQAAVKEANGDAAKLEKIAPDDPDAKTLAERRASLEKAETERTVALDRRDKASERLTRAEQNLETVTALDGAEKQSAQAQKEYKKAVDDLAAAQQPFIKAEEAHNAARKMLGEHVAALSDTEKTTLAEYKILKQELKNKSEGSREHQSALDDLKQEKFNTPEIQAYEKLTEKITTSKKTLNETQAALEKADARVKKAEEKADRAQIVAADPDLAKGAAAVNQATAEHKAAVEGFKQAEALAEKAKTALENHNAGLDKNPELKKKVEQYRQLQGEMPTKPGDIEARNALLNEPELKEAKAFVEKQSQLETAHTEAVVHRDAAGNVATDADTKKTSIYDGHTEAVEKHKQRQSQPSASGVDAPTHVNSDVPNMRSRVSSALSSLDDIATGATSKYMNAASIGSSISLAQRSYEKGDVKGMALAGADAGLNSIELADDAFKALKSASSYISGGAKAATTTAANVADDVALAAAPVLRSSSSILGGAARLAGKLAPGVGVALETYLEEGKFIEDDWSLGSKTIRGVGAGVGAVVGVMAAGVAATAVGAGAAVAAVPLAVAVAVGYEVSAITGMVIEMNDIAADYRKEAARFKEAFNDKDITSVRHRLGKEMVEALQENGATIEGDKLKYQGKDLQLSPPDKDGKRTIIDIDQIDFTKPENVALLNKALDKKIASTQKTFDDTNTWSWWGETLEKHKDAESDLAILKSAQSKMGGFEAQAAELSKRQEQMKALEERVEEAKNASAPAPASPTPAPAAEAAPAPASPAPAPASPTPAPVTPPVVEQPAPAPAPAPRDSMPALTAGQMINLMDANDNNYISGQEFLNAVAKMGGISRFAGALDTDGSRSVSAAEARKAIFEALDKDGSGSITANEITKDDQRKFNALGADAYLGQEALKLLDALANQGVIAHNGQVIQSSAQVVRSNGRSSSEPSIA